MGMRDNSKIFATGMAINMPAIADPWYNIKYADMGYKIDAVTWWNKKGRFTGAKSPRVRRFMRNPNNYELQPYWINRSNGAKLGETYLPPVIIN